MPGPEERPVFKQEARIEKWEDQASYEAGEEPAQVVVIADS